MSVSTGQWSIDRASDTRWSELNPNFTREVMSQAPLDEPCPETAPGRLMNRWTTSLLPHQVQPLWGNRAVQFPVNSDLSSAIRQRPVLHRVSRQFL